MYDDYDEADEALAREYREYKARLSAMAPDQLGKEWDRHCRRHDSAVDRCEELNSPTIEDSQGWLDYIEAEFNRRGLNCHKYVLQD